MSFENNIEENNINNLLKELNIEPFNPDKPENVLFYFNLYMIMGKCGASWELLSKYSKHKILDLLYTTLQESQEELSQQYIVTKDDLKLAFENDDKWLKEYFWQDFVIKSNALFIVEYAQLKSKIIDTNKSQVTATFTNKIGSESKIVIEMLYEDLSWRVGLIETQ